MDRRFKLRILLKLMSFLALLGLSIVMLKSLIPLQGEVLDERQPTNIPLVSIMLANMSPGEIRKTRWQGREVAILKQAGEISIPEIPESQHLNPETRSILEAFFVYFNTGDSGNCPLFFNGNTLKDTCSGKHFDLTGREKQTSAGGFILEVPPHYFVGQPDTIRELVIGQWQPAPK